MLEIIVAGGLISLGVKAIKKRLASSKKEGTKKKKKKPLSRKKTTEPSQGKLPAPSQKRVRNPINQKNLDRDIKIASISTGLAIGGAFLFSPLSLLSIPGLLYVSSPVHKRTFEGVKKGKVTTDTLVSITLFGCVVFGFYTVANIVTLVFAFSQKLLRKVTANSKEKLNDIFKLAPNEVWLLKDGVEVSVSTSQLVPGDHIVITAGETIPIDGDILQGNASIDQHILTGEGIPTEKEAGDEVFASTVVLSGKIIIKVQRAGDETTIAKIAQILNESIEFKSTVELRAQTLADKTVLPTFILSGLFFPFFGSMGSLSVLNAHFKHKMAIIGPISIMNYFKIASENGIIIKDGRSLDLLQDIDTIVFDKTGTLTEEQPTLGDIHICSRYDKSEVLRYTAAAEFKQTHPIARAILQASKKRGLKLPDIEQADYQVGYGLSMTVNKRLVQVGSLRFMGLQGIEIPSSIMMVQKKCSQQGHSLVMVAFDKTLVSAIELIPTIRPEAHEVMRQLKQNPRIKHFYIISGDNETPTKNLAEELGIDNYFAETLPTEKANIIDRLNEEGKAVCYIGDGINDAIALKKSHVSVSMKGASTIAVDTAQIILMDGGLKHLNLLFQLAQEFQKNMNTSFGTLVGASLISLGGIAFFNFNLIATVGVNIFGLAVGVGNSMLPLIRKRQEIDQTPLLNPPPEKILEATEPTPPEVFERNKEKKAS